MAVDSKAAQYAESILQQRRLKAGEIARAAKQALYDQLPELQTLDELIAQRSISQAKRALLGDLAGREAAASEIESLQNRRAELLQTSGADPADLSRYSYCEACGDSGRSPRGGRCICFLELARQYTFRQISKASPLELSSFESFSLEFYADDPDPDWGLAPRHNMRRVFDECLAFANNLPFPDGGNLLLAGDVGLGKTHLALAIANVAIERGLNVIYCSASNIFKKVETEYFDGGHNTATLDALKTCDLLVLDDLGSEFVNSFTAAGIYDIVNTRIVTKRPTVLTTNFTDEQGLGVRYGEKVRSRIVGFYKTLPFFGADIRLIKNGMQ